LAAHGKAFEILHIERERVESGVSFAVEKLRVRARDGRRVCVVLKDLNPLHQVDAARQMRRPALESARRELWMYQRVLSPERFGTARLYGSRWEPQHGAIWLLLEDVGEKPLSKVRDFDMWLAAARWAARFHAAGHELTLDGATRLVPFGRERYRACEERLAALVELLPASRRALLREALDHYRKLQDRLVALTPCLIHGEFFGRNVMVRTHEPDRTIAPIDWETAGLGPGLLDLVSLTSGRWKPEARLSMTRAYFEALQEATQAPLDWDGFCSDLEGVTLFHALGWVTWYADRQHPRHLERWLGQLEKALPERVRAELR